MLDRPATPSQAEIDQAMTRGRQMRARAFGDVLSWLADALRRSVSRGAHASSRTDSRCGSRIAQAIASPMGRAIGGAEHEGGGCQRRPAARNDPPRAGPPRCPRAAVRGPENTRAQMHSEEWRRRPRSPYRARVGPSRALLES